MNFKISTQGRTLSSLALMAILLALIVSPSQQQSDFGRKSKLFESPFQTIFQSYPPKEEDNTNLSLELSNNLFAGEVCTIDVSFESEEVTLKESQLTEMRVTEVNIGNKSPDLKISQFDSARSTHNFIIADITYNPG